MRINHYSCLQGVSFVQQILFKLLSLGYEALHNLSLLQPQLKPFSTLNSQPQPQRAHFCFLDTWNSLSHLNPRPLLPEALFPLLYAVFIGLLPMYLRDATPPTLWLVLPQTSVKSLSGMLLEPQSSCLSQSLARCDCSWTCLSPHQTMNSLNKDHVFSCVQPQYFIKLTLHLNQGHTHHSLSEVFVNLLSSAVNAEDILHKMSWPS